MLKQNAEGIKRNEQTADMILGAALLYVVPGIIIGLFIRKRMRQRRT
jgi:hypothetical protein